MENYHRITPKDAGVRSGASLFGKGTIRALLEAYLREKGIRFYIKGGPTLGSQELGARKEPDESYNLQTKKAIPDLAIEVIFTSGGIDKTATIQAVGDT